jgi:hypothetical protein
MILIAHRGLINGPNRQLENTEFAITVALTEGFDVEVDVWFDENDQSWFLGHDGPTHNTTLEFLSQPGLWLHCKNMPAANKLRASICGYPNLNFFWHENDQRTLTSQGYWWTFPNQELGYASVAVMPEWYINVENLDLCKTWNCSGICSDYVGAMK